MRTAPLWTVADCRPSNVDKKSVDGEQHVRLCNYTDVYYNDHIDSDMDLMHATAPGEQIERFRVQPGDVLITRDSESNEDIGIPALVRTSSPDMVCGYHLTLLRPAQHLLEPSYLFWWLKSRPVEDYWYTNSFGVTRFSLVSTTVWGLRVPLPPLEEQRRIADFLDRETAEIDAMDAELDRLVETLRERREALVIHRLLPYGIPGNLASSAAFGALGYDTSSRMDFAFDLRREANVDPAAQYLSLMKDIGVIKYEDKGNVGNKKPQDLTRCIVVRAGDVLVNSMNFNIGSFGTSRHDGVCSPAYLVLQPKVQNAIPAFITYLFGSSDFRQRVQDLGNGILEHRKSIPWERFAAVRVPLPPIEEQRRIVAELDEQTARIDEMIADANRLKELLAERRSTFITEVVTGVKEVPA